LKRTQLLQCKLLGRWAIRRPKTFFNDCDVHLVHYASKVTHQVLDMIYVIGSRFCGRNNPNVRKQIVLYEPALLPRKTILLLLPADIATVLLSKAFSFSVQPSDDSLRHSTCTLTNLLAAQQLSVCPMDPYYPHHSYK